MSIIIKETRRTQSRAPVASRPQGVRFTGPETANEFFQPIIQKLINDEDMYEKTEKEQLNDQDFIQLSIKLSKNLEIFNTINSLPEPYQNQYDPKNSFALHLGNYKNKRLECIKIGYEFSKTTEQQYLAEDWPKFQQLFKYQMENFDKLKTGAVTFTEEEQTFINNLETKYEQTKNIFIRILVNDQKVIDANISFTNFSKQPQTDLNVINAELFKYNRIISIAIEKLDLVYRLRDYIKETDSKSVDVAEILYIFDNISYNVNKLSLKSLKNLRAKEQDLITIYDKARNLQKIGKRSRLDEIVTELQN